VTGHLRRSLAPISRAGWAAIDEEAARTFRHFLAARAIVDVSGPIGWEHSARTTGRVDGVGARVEGVEARQRMVEPVVELRIAFTVAMDEVDAIDRGARAPDLSPVVDAARQAALAEDLALFHGWSEAGIAGLTDASPHEPVTISDDYEQYPGHVARGVAALRRAGVGGPYALALGPRCHTGVIETTAHGGYPVLEHIRLILGGPVIWAPAVDGAVVVSQRGADQLLTLGQDWSIGYLSHTSEHIELYLEESFDFEIREAAAAAALAYPPAR
jgi:uncharacterized linocin/CFP29 family protein